MTAQLQQTMPPQTRTDPIAPKTHTIGWGGSYATSDAILGGFGGPIRVGVMLSTMYAYHLSSWIHLEASAHLLERTYIHTPAYATFSNTMLSTSLIGDCTAMMQPYDGSASGLWVGLGPSFRWHGRMWNGVTIIPTDPIPIVDGQFNQGVALGINGKIEYRFTLDETLEVGVRAQGYIFADPFVEEKWFFLRDYSSINFGRGFSVSLGGFLRVGW